MGGFEVEQSTIDQIKERILDERFFTARLLSEASKKTGQPAIQIAQYSAGLVVLYLLFGSFNYVLANVILTAYPLLVTHVYSDERPTRDHLLIYWGCFSILTIFDRALENLFAYYVIKVAVLALLFLEPYHFASVIKANLSGYKKNHSRELVGSKRSPPPEKPDEEAFNPKSPITAKSPVATKVEKPLEQPTESDPATAKMTLSARTATSVKSESVPTAPPAAQKSSRSVPLIDIPDRGQYLGSNPMATDSAYQLSSSASLTGVNTEISPGVNPHDLMFLPANKLIFNGPFDYDDITYHMRIMNTGHHNIAFAIKGNCMPRVTAYPPSAIIKPKEKMVIAVTVKKFDYNDTDFNRDRVAFEYVLLKDGQKDVKEFSHKLLQDSDLKRRKNILIQYNP